MLRRSEQLCCQHRLCLLETAGHKHTVSTAARPDPARLPVTDNEPFVFVQQAGSMTSKIKSFGNIFSFVDI